MPCLPATLSRTHANTPPPTGMTSIPGLALTINYSRNRYISILAYTNTNANTQLCAAASDDFHHVAYYLCSPDQKMLLI